MATRHGFRPMAKSAAVTVSTEASTAATLAKPLIAASEVFTGTILGMIMLWGLVVEISVLTYVLTSDANVLSFLINYYKWKANAPIVGYTMMFITLMFPLAAIQLSVGFFTTFTRKAPGTPLLKI